MRVFVDLVSYEELAYKVMLLTVRQEFKHI